MALGGSHQNETLCREMIKIPLEILLSDKLKFI